VTTYLKKQLELLSTQKTASKQSQNRKDEVEQFFNGQWSYALSLTRWQYLEGLLDQRYIHLIFLLKAFSKMVS
jgi:hypothetical protein